MNKMSMTIDDIARLTGRHKTTIQNWIQKTITALNNNSSNSMNNSSKTNNISSSIQEKLKQANISKVRARFNLEETLAIISTGGNNKLLADLLRSNAEKNQISNSPVLLAENQRSAILEHFKRQEKEIAELKTMIFGEPHYPLRISLPRNQKLLSPPEERLPAVPDMDDRDRLNMLIRQYAYSLPGNGFPVAWKAIHEQVYYRLKRNICQLARNASEREERNVMPLDILEREGLLPQAIAIVYELMRRNQS